MNKVKLVLNKTYLVILQDIGHEPDLLVILNLLTFGRLRIFQQALKPLDLLFPFPDLPEQSLDLIFLLLGELDICLRWLVHEVLEVELADLLVGQLLGASPAKVFLKLVSELGGPVLERR